MFEKVRSLIFKLDPELAHSLAIKALKTNLFIKQKISENVLLRSDLFGKEVNSPIGIAAGFDKDAEVYNSLFNLGFSFVEVGTVTPLKQYGNKKPRVFRLEEDEALINRLGFNNSGCESVSTRIKKNKPYVTIKQAISIDNKISNKKSKWISNKDSRKDAQFIRAESCAILIGSETLLKDNPKLNVKLKNSDLNTNIKIRNPIKIILDSKLSIDISKYKLFKGKEKKIIFNNIITDFDENNNIDYIKVSKNNLGLNLESILNILAKKYEINYLMVEPGAKLLKSFVLKNLIDDLIIYKCPLIIGKLGLSSFSICNEYLNKNNIEIDTIKQISNDVKIIYKFKRK